MLHPYKENGTKVRPIQRERPLVRGLSSCRWGVGDSEGAGTGPALAAGIARAQPSKRTP